MKKIIAITGGIGCGKSMVSHTLQIMGYAVYDTDAMAKVLMTHHEPLKQDLCQAFGPDAYCPDGSLNRAALAAVVFSDAKALEKLNLIVHPYVGRDLERWVEDQPDGILFYESAILFESHFERFADAVWCVSAPLELRVSRTMLRDHASRQKVMERIQSQMSQEEKETRSDYVIYNDRCHSVIQQINQILKTSTLE